MSGGGSAEKNGTQEPTNDNINGSETGGDHDSSDNANEELVQVPENVNKSEEIPGDNVEKEDEEKLADGLDSEVKKTDDGEKPSGAPNVDAEEKSAAVIYKDNMDVVMREDLKSVFQKFGTVKVS